MKVLNPNEKFFKKNNRQYFRSRKILVSLKYLGRSQKYKYEGDYVRLATLELLAFEIQQKKLIGDVAEVGVFRGDFARHINLNFPERNFYLFDTFEGFDDRDINVEMSKKYSKGDQNFSQTSVEVALAKMKYPLKCIIKKGYCPATAQDLNANFVFVSIDVDLYQPILEGLKYFYPRLIKGGYIFIHDFNNDEYPGVRKAVEEYCTENGLNFLPIPDAAGTVVIMK